MIYKVSKKEDSYRYSAKEIIQELKKLGYLTKVLEQPEIHYKLKVNAELIPIIEEDNLILVQIIWDSNHLSYTSESQSHIPYQLRTCDEVLIIPDRILKEYNY